MLGGEFLARHGVAQGLEADQRLAELHPGGGVGNGRGKACFHCATDGGGTQQLRTLLNPGNGIGVQDRQRFGIGEHQFAIRRLDIQPIAGADGHASGGGGDQRRARGGQHQDQVGAIGHRRSANRAGQAAIHQTGAAGPGDGRSRLPEHDPRCFRPSTKCGGEQHGFQQRIAEQPGTSGVQHWHGVIQPEGKAASRFRRQHADQAGFGEAGGAGARRQTSAFCHRAGGGGGEGGERVMGVDGHLSAPSAASTCGLR